MFRPMLGMKLTAIAVGVVGTAGVAAATTVVQSPAAPVAAEPAAVASPDLGALPAGLPDLPIPGLPDLGSLVGSLPTVPTLPSVPSVPSVPGLPGTGGLPVDPGSLAGTATDVAAQVTAMLPDPAALQAAVLGCVEDLTALAPVATPDAADPLGFLSGLLGMLGGGGSIPAAPDPAAVQAAVTGCVTNIMSVLPDPSGLASALTTSFGGALPAPVADLVAMLTGQIGGAPDAQHLLDLVTSLTSATGSPTAIVDQLTAALEGALPEPLAGLVALPLSIVDQVFASIGLG